MEQHPFFSLKTLPGNAWPPLPGPQLGLVWLAYRELGRTQWLDPAAVRERQLEQVRLLLAHCAAHVPYYRELLARAGVRPATVTTLHDFRRIPVLPRSVYRERTAEFRADQLPPGTTEAGPSHTSGTSGIPIELRQTNVVRLWWLAFYLRDLEWSGLNPRGTLAGIRTAKLMDPEEKRRFMEGGIAVPCWNPHLDGLIHSGPSYGMDLHQDPRRQLDWLLGLQPDYLLSFPSNLDFLGSLLRERGERIAGLHAIQTFAETLTEEVQARIESAFGVPVKNLYSCSEAGYVASPCPAGHGLHVHAENVLLEVLDEQGRPCPPGRRGKVVLTALHNFLTPFIRYEILDEATLGPEPCPCGRGLPLLTRVWGKCRPLMHLPGGRRKVPVALAECFRTMAGVRQHQVVQRAVDHVVVRLVPDRHWTADLPDQIRRVFEEFFEGPVRIDFELVERLPLPPGGKVVDVICEIDEAVRVRAV